MSGFRFACALLLISLGCTGDGTTSTVATFTSTSTGPAATPEKPPAKTWSHEIASHEVDPADLAMSAEGLKGLCDVHLARARTILAEIKALKGKPAAELSWDAVLGRVDRIAFEVQIAAGFAELMNLAHPDEPMREAGKLCRPKATELATDMMLDPDFAAVVRSYAE